MMSYRMNRLNMQIPCTDSHGVAFPARVNMPDKLDQLEEERNYLLRMCPKEKHRDYEEGKEITLVRNKHFEFFTGGIRRCGPEC